VLHGTANFVPLTGPFARVLTLHDILFRRRPELLPLALRWGTEALVPPAARRAARVIAVSACAREDIVAELRIPRERIDVVPNGVAPPGRGEAAVALARLGAGSRPVLASVATDLPHKNLDALLAGLAGLEPERRPLLAFAGHGTDAGRLESEARRLGVRDDVRMLGALSQGELEDLYAAARGLVTATRWEGFGIPVLEAMARGVPVACSVLPVLHEVAGDAAAFFDPESADAVAAALAELAAGGEAVERRRAAGQARAAGYTWQAAAEGTVAAYERAWRGPRRPRRASR
jgi:glycosyltransferase involved in cell wall biosynthesis